MLSANGCGMVNSRVKAAHRGRVAQKKGLGET